MKFLRIQEIQRAQNEDLKGHLWTTKIFADDPVAMVSDRILPVQVFLRHFVVEIFGARGSVCLGHRKLG